MKKVLIVVLVLALLTIGISVAIAADNNNDEELVERHEEMIKIRQEQLDELVDEGVISQEEADEFIERMEENFESGYCFGEYEGSRENGYHGFGRGFSMGGGGCGGRFFGD